MKDFEIKGRIKNIHSIYKKLVYQMRDFEDIYDCMAVLMGMTWDIDARIEPHPITTEDYEKVSNPFVKEVLRL